MKSAEKIRLHLGCGYFHKSGYVNIDRYNFGSDVDRVMDLNEPLATFEFDNNVEEILAIHLFEHLHRKGIEQVVKSWYRALISGGKLIMELPDFDRCIARYRTGDQSETYLEWIFGNQEHSGQFHYWGWNPERITTLLKDAGFEKVEIKSPQDSLHTVYLCFRVEATKKGELNLP